MNPVRQLLSLLTFRTVSTWRRLTCVYAHERPSVQVVTAADAPAAAVSLVDLEADSDPSLDEAVLTERPDAAAPRPALVHTDTHSSHQTSSLFSFCC